MRKFGSVVVEAVFVVPIFKSEVRKGYLTRRHPGLSIGNGWPEVWNPRPRPTPSYWYRILGKVIFYWLSLRRLVNVKKSDILCIDLNINLNEIVVYELGSLEWVLLRSRWLPTNICILKVAIEGLSAVVQIEGYESTRIYKEKERNSVISAWLIAPVRLEFYPGFSLCEALPIRSCSELSCGLEQRNPSAINRERKVLILSRDVGNMESNQKTDSTRAHW